MRGEGWWGACLARLAVVGPLHHPAALCGDVVAGDDADGGAVHAPRGLAVLAHGGHGGAAGEEGGHLELDAPGGLLQASGAGGWREYRG